MKKTLLVLLLSFGIILSGCSTLDGSQEQTAESNIEDLENSSDVDRVIEIDAFNFGYSMENITVKQGETVRIIMTSTDGTHDFVVDELGVQSATISTNGVTTFEFTANQTGEFEFYCSIGNHRERGMFGTLLVEE